LRYFVPLPPGAVEKGKESSVPGKLELLKVRQSCAVAQLAAKSHQVHVQTGGKNNTR
jgi:hypothetical protein